MTNDFQATFGEAMTKITNREVDKSYEVYLALYQGISGTEEQQNAYKQFSPDFFDLICGGRVPPGQRGRQTRPGGAGLEYFAGAAQIGLTATPKETADVSNIDYFGEPVYTYSLRQGIEDGFLAPYKVIRIDLDRDVDGWRPRLGELDRYGTPIPNELFTSRDFDRTLVLDERTKVVAWRVSEYLRQIGRYQKSIVFCEDIEHAERMRHAIANQNGDLVHENRRYVMRITGDNPAGKTELDNFISPEERYPVVATTSKLLNTGVDSQTCHLIVLDRTINTMTEFKQIIGRGTRIREDFGKTFFTIIDFRNVTRLFADPDFDGEPVQIYEPGPHDPTAPDDEAGATANGDDGTVYPKGGSTGSRIVERPERRQKYYVDAVEVQILAERVQYLDRGRQPANRLLPRFQPREPARPLCLAGRLPEALERSRTQGGHSGGAGGARLSAGAVAGADDGRPGPLRPDLPCGFRPRSDDAQRTRPQRPQERGLRPIWRHGAAHAGGAAGQVRRPGHRHHRGGAQRKQGGRGAATATHQPDRPAGADSQLLRQQDQVPAGRG
jgi:type I restriction enzyme R subunit